MRNTTLSVPRHSTTALFSDVAELEKHVFKAARQACISCFACSCDALACEWRCLHHRRPAEVDKESS